jgi:hypothetical protein
MGYIGLLLNAPYKIDSMVWMRMMIKLNVRSNRISGCPGYKNQGVILKRGALKCS